MVLYWSCGLSGLRGEWANPLHWQQKLEFVGMFGLSLTLIRRAWNYCLRRQCPREYDDEGVDW